MDSGLGLPDASNNSESKLLNFFRTNNYLVAAFGDKTNTSGGNQIRVYDLPFPDSPSPTNLLNAVSYTKNETDSDEYLVGCFSGDRNDDSIVFVEWQPNNNNQYISRLYVDGSNNWVHEVLMKLNDTGSQVELYIGDGSSFLNGNFYFSIASKVNNESVIVRDDGTTVNSIKNGTQIPYRPMTDPNVYPRYPHGENWIRDGSIGVNQGFFIASVDAPVSRNFSWNAQRYEEDLLYDNIRDTLEEYQSPI